MQQAWLTRDGGQGLCVLLGNILGLNPELWISCMGLILLLLSSSLSLFLRGVGLPLVSRGVLG